MATERSETALERVNGAGEGQDIRNDDITLHVGTNFMFQVMSRKIPVPVIQGYSVSGFGSWNEDEEYPDMRIIYEPVPQVTL